jgi:hypothetical protein
MTRQTGSTGQLSLGLEHTPAPRPAPPVPWEAVQVLADLLLEALGIAAEASQSEVGDDAQDHR